MIEVTTRDHVTVLRLARPPVNAINLEFVQSFAAAIERAAAPSESRALVLTGLPGVFSAGIDTREVPGYDAPTRATMLRTINRAIFALYGCPKPTVAAVSGHALGGGLVLALGCDLRLAAQGDFRLGLTEVDAGIPFPAGPLAVVQAELPADRVRVLALTGAVADPASPVLSGVIDRVVSAESLLEEAVRAAQGLADKPGYVRVKFQLRSPVLARMRRIVEEDEEPLLTRWI